MDATILTNLKDNRGVVESRFNELNVVFSKQDFFKVVFDHFETLSKIMINKILKSNTLFATELHKACEKAEYKAHEGNRKSNINMMIKNQKTNTYNG